MKIQPGGLLGMVTFRGLNLRKHILSGPQAYAFALFCVALAGLARWTIGLVVDEVVPFTTFFPAVLLAGLLGGIGPGIFAALLGGVIGWWAFLQPTMAGFPLTLGQRISLIAYLVTSLIIVWAADHY